MLEPKDKDELEYRLEMYQLQFMYAFFVPPPKNSSQVKYWLPLPSVNDMKLLSWGEMASLTQPT